MSSVLTLIGLAAGGWVVIQIFRFGDDLNGWFSLRDRWRKWKRKKGRRNSPYLYVAAAVVALYLLVTQAAARAVGWFGVMTAGKLSWAVTRWALRFWFIAGLILAGCVAYQQLRRRRHYMAGEPANPKGLARAALRHLVREATADALQALRGKGEGQCPVPGNVDYFTVTAAGRTVEYGLRVRLHMKRGMTIANVQANTSDGMDPVHDRLATYVNASLHELVEARTPEARRMIAYAGRPPTLPYTAVSLIHTKHGAVNPAFCDLLLLRKNPLEEVHRYPKQRPQVADLGRPILVGLDIQGRPAQAVLREQMTGVFGGTGTGKSFYVLNLAIGASQCPNVAFVVIDMKGRTGDLMSLASRAAVAVHDHEGATVALDWLVDEMTRRANRAGEIGKITRFTPELPEIVVWADEWHEWTYDLPTKDASGRRMEAMQRLIRRARAFGIYIVASTQIAHATGANAIPTSITGQFHNKVSTRLGGSSHTGMVFPNVFTGSTGPHHIPHDWKGVAYGQFGEGGRITMIRSLLSGPEVAARWMTRDAQAGLNVPLPGLAAALEAHDLAGRQPVLTAVGAVNGLAPARVAVPLDDLPSGVLDAAVACWAELHETAPERITARGLTDLAQRARSKAENRKGATADEKASLAAHRETIRLYTHPTS